MKKIFHIDGNFIGWNRDFLKKLLVQIADMKFDSILWELENQVHFDTLASANLPGAMSKKAFKEILDLGYGLGLKPIPLLQTIGHAEYVLRNPDFFPLRENPNKPDCYCTSNPAVKLFLSNMLEEYLELFDNIEHFHLGGDEANVFGTCPNCKEAIKAKGYNRFYSDYLEVLAAPVLRRKIKPGIWDDMTLLHSDQINDISHDFVLWDWNYWAGEENLCNNIMLFSPERTIVPISSISEETFKDNPALRKNDGSINSFYTVDLLQKNNFQMILCCASRSGGDGVFLSNYRIHADNIIGTIKSAQANNINGICVTSWAIRYSSYSRQVPLLLLVNETLYNLDLPQKQIQLKCYQKLFGEDAGLLFFHVNNEEVAAYPFCCSHLLGAQWSGYKDFSLPPPDFIDQQLEIYKKDSSTWSNRYADLDKARQQLANFQKNLSKAVKAAHNNRKILEEYLSDVEYNEKYCQLLELVLLKDDGRKVDLTLAEILLDNLRNYTLKVLSGEETLTTATIKSNILWDSLGYYFDRKPL